MVSGTGNPLATQGIKMSSPTEAVLCTRRWSGGSSNDGGVVEPVLGSVRKKQRIIKFPAVAGIMGLPRHAYIHTYMYMWMSARVDGRKNGDGNGWVKSPPKEESWAVLFPNHKTIFGRAPLSELLFLKRSSFIREKRCIVPCTFPWATFSFFRKKGSKEGREIYYYKKPSMARLWYYYLDDVTQERKRRKKWPGKSHIWTLQMLQITGCCCETNAGQPLMRVVVVVVVLVVQSSIWNFKSLRHDWELNLGQNFQT